jgi:CubicO group peptidase (beta-lactamase class C family)
MRSASVLSIVLIAAFAAAIPATAKPDIGAANAALATVMKKAKSPGAGFAVGDGGRVVDAKGFGKADLATGTSVGPDTMFALASCSKPITAMAVMKLVDEHKVTLDTRAFEFLGIEHTSDPRAARITVKDLLNHSSGLPHDVNASTDDPMNTARAAARAKLKFAPGTQQAYSNAGFNVAGAVIEKASGQKYIDFVRENVFEPAGVTRFAALEQSGAVRGQAVRYSPNRTVIVNKRVEGGTPAGGWILAPADYVKILIAYDAGKIVSPASRAAMLAPPVAPLQPRSNGSAFGLGWDVVSRTAKDPDTVFYGKNGGIAGAHTWVEHRPDGIVYAAFYNGGSGIGAHPSGLKAVEKALDGK